MRMSMDIGGHAKSCSEEITYYSDDRQQMFDKEKQIVCDSQTQVQLGWRAKDVLRVRPSLKYAILHCDNRKKHTKVKSEFQMRF